MAAYPETYPFPSKVHVTSSVTIRLNDSSYLLWKTQVESLLSSQELLGFINGHYPAPPATVVQRVGEVEQQTANPADESWFCTDQLVKSWIFGTLSEEALGSVCSLSTAQEVLTSLANTYNRSSIGREFDLKRKLQLLTKQGKSYSVYVREYTSICDQLSSIGKPVDDAMKICGFLNGLGREYDPITTVVQSSMSRLPTPSFTDVLFEVQGFDSRLQAYDTGSVTPHMAFQTQERQQEQAYQTGVQNRGLAITTTDPGRTEEEEVSHQEDEDSTNKTLTLALPILDPSVRYMDEPVILPSSVMTDSTTTISPQTFRKL